MLRFLSNYLFQNENQPENDPTTISNSEQQGPKCNDDLKEDGHEARSSTTKEEFMDFMEGERESDEEDDWVLIGEGENKQVKVKQGGEVGTVQEQPVSLVAASSDEGCDTQEEDKEDLEGSEGSEEDEEDEDEEEEEPEPGHLLWENKLIEHPSMSVYVDLATSISSNGVNSCVSLSSIAPATSPGESVIVIEGHDEDSDDEEEDEDMDIVEVLQPEVKASSQKNETMPPAQEDNVSDLENNNNFVKSKPTTSAVGTAAPIQNGRRKKGHYPCTSSNSSQMPRRAHLRSSGGNTRNNQTFQMISSNSWSSNASLGGQSPDNMHDSTKRKRPSNNASTASNGNAAASACGIAIVGGAGPNPAVPSMVNKNLKLAEMFPTAAPSAKRRQRHSPPQKGSTQPKGHFLQESRRRQDLQNCNKRSNRNNDRRTAQQRRVQKVATTGAGGARK